MQNMQIVVPVKEDTEHNDAKGVALTMWWVVNNKSENVLVIKIRYYENDERTLVVSMKEMLRAVKTLAQSMFVLTKNECD